jgi:hypothetical protein
MNSQERRKITEPAVGQEQRQGQRKTRDGERQGDDFFDRAREPIAAQMQRISRRNPDDQGHAERRKCNHQGAENRFRIELPYLHHPLQSQAGLNAAKVIERDAGEHRQRRRHDQKRGD